MVPGAFDYLVAGTCSPLRVCASICFRLFTVWVGVRCPWGVGQLADRPAVNREVGGSNPPAPVFNDARAPDQGAFHGLRSHSRHLRTGHEATATLLALCRRRGGNPPRGGIYARGWRRC